MSNRSIESLRNSLIEECTGCSACFNKCPENAIVMKMDRKGFWYPHVRDNCIGCKSCIRVCPSINKPTFRQPTSYYGATVNDQMSIANCASGGIFFIISEQVINESGIVSGAVLNNDGTVEHYLSADRHIRDRMCGSKYVQSDLKNVFSSILSALNNPNPVLFSGTPCQVAGLYSFLGGKRPSNLITIEILCHGVGSNKVYLDYRRELECRYGDIKKYSFRDRKYGMHGSNVSIEFESGKLLENEFEGNSFDRLYGNAYLMRDSCYSCLFSRKERIGDITIGDYWGIEKHRPDWDTSRGASLVLINSSVGERWWRKVLDKVEYFETNYDSCMQGSMSEPVRKPLDYKSFWNKYSKYGFKMCANYFLGYSFPGKMHRLYTKIVSKMVD